VTKKHFLRELENSDFSEMGNKWGLENYKILAIFRQNKFWALVSRWTKKPYLRELENSKFSEMSTKWGFENYEILML